MIPVIHIGSAVLSTYRLMLVAAALFTSVSVYCRRGFYRMSAGKCIFLSLSIYAFGGFCGGKILHTILNWDSVLEYGFTLRGGLTIFGSMFFVIIVAFPLGKLFRVRPETVLDFAAPGVALTIGFQRIGCYLAGCCGGWEVELGNFAFRWPTQAMESMAGFVIYSILVQKEKENDCAGRRYPLFLISYGVIRFLVEFLRETKKSVLYLSQWQWFAITAILVGFIWNLIVKKERIDA